MSDPGGVDKHEDPLIGRGEIDGNVTSGADFEDGVIITEEHDPMQVTSHSGARQRLDKGWDEPGAASEREPGWIGDRRPVGQAFQPDVRRRSGFPA